MSYEYYNKSLFATHYQQSLCCVVIFHQLSKVFFFSEIEVLPHPYLKCIQNIVPNSLSKVVLCQYNKICRTHRELLPPKILHLTKVTTGGRSWVEISNQIQNFNKNSHRKRNNRCTSLLKRCTKLSQTTF